MASERVGDVKGSIDRFVESVASAPPPGRVAQPDEAIAEVVVEPPSKPKRKRAKKKAVR